MEVKDILKNLLVMEGFDKGENYCTASNTLLNTNMGLYINDCCLTTKIPIGFK